MFPGQYQLSFDPEALPKGFYLSSAMSGQQDMRKEGLRIGDHEGEIEILISSGAGRVIGTVHDSVGQPVPEVRVVLIPPAGNRGAFTEIRTAVTVLLEGSHWRTCLPGTTALCRISVAT